MEDRNQSRRTVIKRMAYVAPIVLTLAATPAFASNGSGEQNNNTEKHKGKRKRRH
jgi:hypothetical protein